MFGKCSGRVWDVFAQALHRPCTGLAQALHRPCTGLAQALHRPAQRILARATNVGTACERWQPLTLALLTLGDTANVSTWRTNLSAACERSHLTNIRSANIRRKTNISTWRANVSTKTASRTKLEAYVLMCGHGLVGSA